MIELIKDFSIHKKGAKLEKLSPQMEMRLIKKGFAKFVKGSNNKQVPKQKQEKK